MSFLEQVDDVAKLEEIGYGCYNIVLGEPLENHMQIRHIFGKMDYIVSIGNYGTPEQFLTLFKEICDYLGARDIGYRLKFKWVLRNNPYFNIKCAILLCMNSKRLKDYMSL